MRMAFLYTTHELEINKMDLAEPFEMNVKIEQGSDFDVDNGRRLFFDAQEAKKVSKRTVVQ